MNKCYKCGREFNGQFCPNCGTKYEAEKACPDCGAILNGEANFCNHCGYRLETDDMTAQMSDNAASSYEFGIGFYKTICKILKWTPCVLFLLFAVLNFVFMNLSAYSAFGFDMGNVYKLSNGDYKLTATALIVLSALSALLALAYPLLIGKRPKTANALMFVMYALVLIASSVLNVQIKKDDWAVDISTKLLIAFAVIFGALSALLSVTDRLLNKKSEKYRQAKTSTENKTKPSILDKIAHNTKEWYSAHKKAVNGTIIGVCSVAVVCVLIFAVIVPLATNIFTDRKLSKINLGDSKDQVVKILGKPYGGNTEANHWDYYGDEFVDLMKQQDELNKKIENLSDFNELGQLMEQQAKLDEKIANTTGKYIAVTFNNNQQVTTVTYNAAYNKLTSSKAKAVKSVTVGENNTVDIADITNNNVKVTATFADGSFKMYTLPSSVQASDFGEIKSGKNFPSSATIAWSDNWGEYNKNVKIEESNYNFTWQYNSNEEKLYLDGTIPSIKLLKFFQINDFPWKDNVINTIEIGENVSSLPNLTDLVADFNGVLIVSDYNHNLTTTQGMIFNKDGNLIYISNSTKASNVIYTQWYQNQADGLVYLNGSLIGYKGEMPSNYTLEVKNGITTILANAFSNQKNLASVTIPDSVTSIGSDAFYNCSNITSITIGNSVTSIGDYAFYNCSNITSITIGNSVTSIGSYAFYNCRSLTSLYYQGDIASWCNISFGNTDANPLDHAHRLYLNNKLITELVIPDTVTEIKPYAFSGCKSITSITIPDSVTKIGDEAFSFCSNLTSITIPDSVTSIGNDAFHDCSHLTSVTIGNSVTSIGAWAFRHCSNLTSITIPDSVTSIGSDAFYNCRSLTEIKFEGTIAQWNAIAKGNGWKKLVPATKVICSDGEIEL